MAIKTKKKIRLMDFFGILSKEAGDALEKSILDARKLHREMHKKRITRLKEEFNN